MTAKPIYGAVSDDDSRGHRHALGRSGEQLAAEYLRQLGLIVLSRNWRCVHGELDLVATDGHSVVVCEVKSRSGVDYGSPLEAVDEQKVARLRQLAREWLREHRVSACPVRFDVISVLWPPDGTVRIDHRKEVC